VTPNTTPTRRHQPARPCGRRADRASPGTAQHVACILVLAHRRMRRSACGGTVILTSRERAGFVTSRERAGFVARVFLVVTARCRSAVGARVRP
jgi:hypothetical protein